MVSISTMVGDIPVQEKSTFVEENETYYVMQGTFIGVTIPVIVSSLIWRDDYFGKVCITGYLDNRPREGQKYAMHFFCHTLRPAEVDDFDSKEITLYARITKMGTLFPTRRGTDSLRIVATQTTHSGKTVVIPIIAKGQAARALSAYAKGDYINEIGFLNRDKDRYSVVIKKVVNVQQ